MTYGYLPLSGVTSALLPSSGHSSRFWIFAVIVIIKQAVSTAHYSTLNANCTGMEQYSRRYERLLDSVVLRRRRRRRRAAQVGERHHVIFSATPVVGVVEQAYRQLLSEGIPHKHARYGHISKLAYRALISTWLYLPNAAHILGEDMT